MGIYEQAKKAREAIKLAFLKENWEYVFEIFKEFLAGDMNHFARVPSSYVKWEEVFEPTAKITVFAMSMMPLDVDSSVYVPLTENITFYDIAEGLMAAYTFGRFDIQFMPKARLVQEKTGKRISLRRVKRFMEELGVMKNGMLTGIGQALAKVLIYGAVNRTSVAESTYLSMLLANTLLTEMRQFNSDSVRISMLEAITRYKMIMNTIREWQKTAPKLYLREIPIHYSWEDAIKDIALILVEKKEDFRFTV
jgi:hypothetical protein